MNSEEDYPKILCEINDYSLVLAACIGNVRLVKAILDQNYSARMYEALNFACQNGNLEIVQLLVEYRNFEPWTFGGAVRTLIEHGHRHILEFFLDRRLIAPDYDKGIFLQHSFTVGKLDIIKLLVNRGLRIRITKYNLVQAASLGYLDVFEYLRELNLTSHYEIESFRRATVYGHLEVLKYLISQGYRDGDSLALAAKNGHLEIVEFLLDNEFDVHFDNELALIGSIYSHNLQIVKVILDFGANIHIKNDNPVRLTVFEGEFEIANLLIKAGANLEVIDPGYHSTMLYHYVLDYDLPRAKFLLRAGANPNTAISAALIKQNLEMLELLLSFGGQPDQDELEEALRSKNIPLIQLLMSAGLR